MLTRSDHHPHPMPAPPPPKRLLPLLKDAFAPLRFFLFELWQAAAPLAPDGVDERVRRKWKAMDETRASSGDGPPPERPIP
ncbi:MAG TPA: hypothetical protein EYP25_11455 [Anaerolineae bacterium]|nr:hypothetical protein [Caldilineae bacterium]HID35159.1 hypothetical protein [Anaerolineae bacterium]